MKSRTILLGISLLVLTAAVSVPAMPRIFNYQGRVAVDGVNFDGTGLFKFALVEQGEDLSRQATATAWILDWDDGQIESVMVDDWGYGYFTAPNVWVVSGSGAGAVFEAQVMNGQIMHIDVIETGSGYEAHDTQIMIDPPAAALAYVTLWSNDGSSWEGSEPASAVELPVTKGLYSVMLGDDSIQDMWPIDADVFQSTGLYLRVWFDDGVNGSQALSPNPRIGAAGYAMMAGGVADGAVTAGKIASGAVNASHLTAGSVYGVHIVDAAIHSTHLMNNAVTSGKIATGAVSDNKIADGAVTETKLGIASVITSSIADGAVGENKLAPGAVSAITIAAGAVTESKLADGAVTGMKIAAGAVASNKIDWATMPTSSLKGYAENGPFANAPSATGDNAIAMGDEAEVSGNYSVIGGGRKNLIQGQYGWIGGGQDNWISTDAGWAAILGGRGNVASQNYSLVAGRRAWAMHQGAFVLADSTDASFMSESANTFNARFAGGYRLTGGPITGDGSGLYNLPGGSGGGHWEESGGNVYRATGRVGIGTASPSDTLHVHNGNAVISSGNVLVPDGRIAIGKANASQKLDIGTSSETAIRVDSSSPSSPFMECRGWTGSSWTPLITLQRNGTIQAKTLNITGGSDLSEGFNVSDTTGVEPGVLMVIDPNQPGKLRISEAPYDRRVAGIVSGAGGVNPGLKMGQQGTIADGDYPIALSGRAYCWADASQGAIQPGDLLTTSALPGHAMRADDTTRTPGAVIGKAMTPLADGQGLVLVLISLQ